MGRRLLSALAAGAVAVAAAGCGGAHAGGGAAGAGTTAGGQAFSACMRAHGVPDYPDVAANGPTRFTQVNGRVTIDGVALKETAAQVQTARQKCLPGVAATTANTPPNAVVASDALAYARCMRAHGVPNFPDPTFKGGIQFADHGNYDPNSAAFAAASAACQSSLTAAVQADQSALGNGSG